jgi:hypothetical protein
MASKVLTTVVAQDDDDKVERNQAVMIRSEFFLVNMFRILSAASFVAKSLRE